MKLLTAAVCATLTGAPVYGQTPNAPHQESRQRPLELETVTVAASKTPQPEDALTTTVSVITDAEIEAQMATSIAELVRYQPGISVRNQGSRFGSDGFTIRGVGGNRVQIEVDGVDAPDNFSIGSFSNASRDLVDLNAVKQVEIVKGPGSALFGSDALGGVVSFVTLDPVDYLRGEGFGADVSAGYDSYDASQHYGASLGVQNDHVGAYLRLQHRDIEERDNEYADPFAGTSDHLLGKFVINDLAGAPLRVTFDAYDAASRTDVDSREGIQDFTSAFGFPYVVDTSLVSADDSKERFRISLDQQWRQQVGPFDYFRWRISAQESETRQRTHEQRDSFIAGEPGSVIRNREFLFEQDYLNAEVTAMNSFNTGGLSHALTWGLEWQQMDTAQRRDGTELDLITGQSTNVVGPDVFPVRDFPLSETTEVGVYVQDRIAVMDTLAIIPALRWDHYDLDARSDAIFSEDNPGIAVEGLDESQVSPKLGVLWDATENMSVFAQYAEGFRAPPVNDVNVGFTNFQFGYTAIPNPDLRSETSEGVELGLRAHGNRWSFESSIYQTEYEDFIESFQVVGFDPINELLIFQSVNLDAVTIRGAEAQLAYQINNNWRTAFSAAYTHGDNDLTNQPLNTIDPLKGVLQLHYQPETDFSATAALTGVARKRRVDESSGELARSNGYGVLDIYGQWRPTKNMRLRAGMFNALDRNYLAWNNIRGLAPNSAALNRLEAPGRTYRLFFDISF